MNPHFKAKFPKFCNVILFKKLRKNLCLPIIIPPTKSMQLAEKTESTYYWEKARNCRIHFSIYKSWCGQIEVSLSKNDWILCDPRIGIFLFKQTARIQSVK